MKYRSFSSTAVAAMVLALSVGGTAALPAQAEAQNGEQGQVRKERRAGNILSSRQIEKIVLPRMSGMQYIGPEYDPAAMAYRLKFIENGKVYYVDVDARTGRIIGQSN
ncbi:PepSY domain-containing protein [Novosphingobium mangrovi (ex Hu et al. 2023)]|nr:PepSY domain-containing protein [Novosphingobium mangrovi (ex Hu et al. 2023)]